MISNGFLEFALVRNDVIQRPFVMLSPKMNVVARVDQVSAHVLTTSVGERPVFSLQLQQHAPPSAFPAPRDSRAPRCKGSPRRRGRRVSLHTRLVHAGTAANEDIARDLQPRALTAKCVPHHRSP